jgi:hypothetical protein
MPNFTHEEIVQNFLSSKSIDFNALGKFVGEFGPQIAASSRGDYGVRFGGNNVWACFKNIMPIQDLTEARASGIASEVIGK